MEKRELRGNLVLQVQCLFLSSPIAINSGFAERKDLKQEEEISFPHLKSSKVSVLSSLILHPDEVFLRSHLLLSV